MEVPQTDYNKGNKRWTDRIHRENMVNAKQRSAGFECHRCPDRLQCKINNLPAPSERQKRILEYMQNKEACDTNNPIITLDSLSPRGKFYFPQCTSHDLGWSMKSQPDQLGAVKPKNVITGLYNRRKDVVSHSSPVRGEGPTSVDHTLGYVTMLGDNSHPNKGMPRLLSLDIQKPLTPADADFESLSDPLEVSSLPGDFHILPHEWKYRLSHLSPRGDVVTSREPSESIGAVSIPTTVVRRIDANLTKCFLNQGPFMNRSRSNKWYRPLNSNDVSRYGDAYVKCMHCGPFNKSQLLVSR